MAAIDHRARWQIADVLDRTDLAALLDELTVPSTQLGPGRRWHCPMPEHDDHRASVTMHSDRHGHERWRCWSGDHRGDAIDLVTAVSNRNRSEAIDWLATRAGMVPDRPLPPIAARSKPASPPPATMMDPLVARYVHACHRVLQSSGGREVRSWLYHRGFDDETISANLVGADPGRSLMGRARGLPFGSAAAATFPTLDPAGNVTYVQARYLDPDATGRKYDNPAAALAPHPRLGFVAAPSLIDTDHVLVCEGMPDALTAAQAGYRSVGLLGAQTPDESVAARLVNYADNVGARARHTPRPRSCRSSSRRDPRAPHRRSRHRTAHRHATRWPRSERLVAHRSRLGVEARRRAAGERTGTSPAGADGVARGRTVNTTPTHPPSTIQGDGSRCHLKRRPPHPQREES